MRIAWNDKEAKEYFKLCSEEGLAFFNDDRMLIEKFVDKPRHVEIQVTTNITEHAIITLSLQVLADKHGNAIYLNERECSIQRRNQKVIEEAPSPFLNPETRTAMGKQAVDLSKAIGYDSAGTVEFLVDGEMNFYFLEMNTRLQVEHPITECITGADLVHQMIRSAAGHPLKLSQEDIGINGWAVENRVYAEDPTKNFGMPSIGRLHRYIEPSGQGVRCDSGIEEGSEISVYYDPMICKLTTYGQSRQEALDRSVEALDRYVIGGVTHNIPLLRDILLEERFRAGDFTTNYLPQTYPEGFQGVHLSTEESFRLAAFAAAAHAKDSQRAGTLLNASESSTTATTPKSWELLVKIRDQDYLLTVANAGESYRVSSRDGRSLSVPADFKLSDAVVSLDMGDGSGHHVFQLSGRRADGALNIRYNGTALDIPVMPALAASYLPHMKEKPKLDLAKVVLTPMPGVVTSVEVEEGQAVGVGQAVCYVEAMKMKNAMSPTAAGKIKKILVSPGQKVEEDQILVELE